MSLGKGGRKYCQCQHGQRRRGRLTGWASHHLACCPCVSFVVVDGRWRLRSPRFPGYRSENPFPRKSTLESSLKETRMRNLNDDVAEANTSMCEGP